MTATSTAPRAANASRCVLIIEDEVLIAMVLEDMLEIAGHVVIATAASIAEAEAAVDAGGFDLVIADVHLGSDSIYPLADRIVAAGIPLILSTGSHRDQLPARFAAMPVLEKPYTLAAVETVLVKNA